MARWAAIATAWVAATIGASGCGGGDAAGDRNAAEVGRTGATTASQGDEDPPEAALFTEGARRVANVPVEPGADAVLEVVAEPFQSPPLCDGGEHLVIRLRQDGALLDEHRFEARCEGACTEKEKRKGEERIAEIEEQIDKGEAVESELDYNFTDCIALGHQLGGDLSDELGRGVLVVESDELGPHGIPEREARLVTAGCGAVQVSERLYTRRARSPARDDSTLRAVPGDAGEPWEAFVVELTTAGTEDAPERTFAVSFDADDCLWTLD